MMHGSINIRYIDSVLNTLKFMHIISAAILCTNFSLPEDKQSGQDHKCVELYLHSLTPLETEDGSGISSTLNFYHR